MSSFVFHITNLINQVEVFGDFIRTNQNRDVFMDVEADRHPSIQSASRGVQDGIFVS